MHFSRTAAGTSSAAMRAARCSATAISGSALMCCAAARRRSPGMRLIAITTAKVITSMMMPSTAMAPRSPNSLRSKISTEMTLVSEVNRMIGGGQFADHADEDEAPGGDHAGAQQRRRDVAERLQPRRAEDAACLLEIGIDGAERRLQLLVGGRQRDGDEGDEQDPQRAVEHEGRARVAEEQPDAEHDARHRDRRGRQECEHAPARDRLARREVGDHDRDHRADGRGQQARG